MICFNLYQKHRIYQLLGLLLLPHLNKEYFLGQNFRIIINAKSLRLKVSHFPIYENADLLQQRKYEQMRQNFCVKLYAPKPFCNHNPSPSLSAKVYLKTSKLCSIQAS
jgi:hypothetical protein